MREKISNYKTKLTFDTALPYYIKLKPFLTKINWKLKWRTGRYYDKQNVRPDYLDFCHHYNIPVKTREDTHDTTR